MALSDLWTSTTKIVTAALYTGTLTDSSGFPLQYRQMVDVYTFADLYEAPSLRHGVIRAFEARNLQDMRLRDILPDFAERKRAYETLPASSALCKLFVSLYVNHFCAANNALGIDENDLTAIMEDLPAPFLVGVLTGQFGRIDDTEDRKRRGVVLKSCQCCNGSRTFSEEAAKG